MLLVESVKLESKRCCDGSRDHWQNRGKEICEATTLARVC